MLAFAGNEQTPQRRLDAKAREKISRDVIGQRLLGRMTFQTEAGHPYYVRQQRGESVARLRLQIVQFRVGKTSEAQRIPFLLKAYRHDTRGARDRKRKKH